MHQNYFYCHAGLKPNFSRLTTLLLFSALTHLLPAQNTREQHQQSFTLHMSRTATPVHVDGDLSEECWQHAEKATQFWMKWPRDGGQAPAQTFVQCAYDDKFLYVAATCMDTGASVIQSLKRDVGYWDSDGFAVILDPTNTAGNGYFFGINANGVQTEGLVVSGVDDMDKNWDNIWLAETRHLADRWTLEYAIPLRILRFEAGKNTWGINFVRNDLSNGIYSVWAPIPFQFEATDLGWTGALQWDQAPGKVKGNYNLIPYAKASLSKDYEDGTKVKPAIDAGIDAKVGVGAGMNLDLTFNPDFSQVEIDEQVVNLSRFDVQLPEKRTFFLENGDLFSNLGIPPLRPFFSRRIGLDEDGAAIPIWGGMRLSGNLNAQTRLGIMNMLTRGQGDSLPAQNYSSIAINRRLLGRSSVSAYYLGRESFQGSDYQKDAYSRNAGLELNYTSNDGKWSAWGSHHHSFKSGINSNNWWGNTGFNYATRKLNVLVDMLHMGENYYADLGFEQRIENYDVTRDSTFRLGYNFIFTEITHSIFPKKRGGKINFIELGAELFNVFNPNGTMNEISDALSMTINYQNTSELKFSVSPSWANVPVSFSFSDEDISVCPALPAAYYHYVSARVRWSSDYRKKMGLTARFETGGFYNGEQTSASVGLSYRIQPIANINISAEYNRLDFPEPYCDVQLFNITPRVEVFLSKKLLWTTFLQYNTQADNFNINSRLQWRFRPMSDIFLVYTDNYAVNIWGPRNRAFVVKASYWL